MGNIKEIVEIIENKLEEMGYRPTDEVFDFDSVPASIVNKAFRIEARLTENPYYPGKVANPKQEISIYIAYKEKRSMRTVWKQACDEMEAIEKELINPELYSGLSSDPVVLMDTEASAMKYLENYLVMRLVFRVDYLRDISL